MSAQDALETETLKGYVPLDEYKRRREELKQEATLKSLNASVACAVGLPAKGDSVAAAADGLDETKKKRKKGKAGGGVGLSFDDGEAGTDDAEAASEPVAAKRVFKAPGVDTSFLAKNATEKESDAKRQQTMLREMLEQQERVKGEEVEMHFVFRNEQAKKLLGNQFYRSSVRVLRGESASTVLDAVHRKLSAELSEKVSSQLLLAVSNDYLGLIAHNHMSLFDVFALEWTEGGPMFEFGKSSIVVVERAFFEVNKHLSPMNSWALFDPAKKCSLDEAIRSRDRSVGVEVVRGKGGVPAKSGQRA